MTDIEPQHERSRSPSYPYVNLQQAVELLEKFAKKYRNSRVQITIALQEMGYAMSGMGIRVIAALTQFGLIEVEGSKDARRIWLSRLGKAILFPNPSDANAKITAIRESALLPEIHKWIYEYYKLNDNLLPSNEVMEYDLVNEMGFLHNTVSALIKEFKDTFSFAQLEITERFEFIGAPPETNDAPQMITQPTQDNTGYAYRLSPDPDMREFNTPLTHGKIARLLIPKSLNSKDFELLVMWLNMLKLADLYQESDDPPLTDKNSQDQR